MRILVTGSREWTDRDAIEQALGRIPDGPHTLIHGNARGADLIACETAHALGWEIWGFPADWKRHGKAAGPIRNRQMLDYDPELVLAFPLGESKGTRDMVRLAERAGIPVVEVAL